MVGVVVDRCELHSDQGAELQVGSIGRLPAIVAVVERDGQLSVGGEGHKVDGGVGIDWAEFDGQRVVAGRQRLVRVGGDGEHQPRLERFDGPGLVAEEPTPLAV